MKKPWKKTDSRAFGVFMVFSKLIEWQIRADKGLVCHTNPLLALHIFS